MKFVRFTEKGIYCVPGRFYLDPWSPVNYAVISHGHADHARWGMKNYLCQHHSKKILQHRIGKDINIESLAYGRSKNINGVKLSFHPAGHIIGSAQIRLEYKGYVTVFTGDYKTSPDYLTIPFEPLKCHTLITESTFGLPIYKWLPEDELKRQMLDWIDNNRAHNRTSVFFGYSLGKAQRIMKILENTDRIFVHRAIHNLNEAIRASKIVLPETTLLTNEFSKSEVMGKIVVMPPALLGSNLLKRIPNAATAICSGWMQVRGNRKWRGVDAGFPVSDHADWDGLLDAVKRSGAEQIYVTHGSQAVFSKYLNEIGLKAHEVMTEYGADELSAEEPERSTV